MGRPSVPMSPQEPTEPEPILASSKRLFGDTFLLSAAGLLSRTKGVVFIPIVVGAVGFADYGAFIQIFVIAKLAASLCSLELGMGFERFASPLRRDVAAVSEHFLSVLVAALALALVGGAALFASSAWLSDLFLDGRHGESLRIAALVVVSNTLFGTVRAFLWSQRRFAKQSFLSVTYELLPYVGFVVAVVTTGELLPGILAYTLLDLVAAGWMLVVALRGLEWRRPSAAIVRSYARYSAPLALTSVEGGLLDRADRFFVAGFLGLEAVGVYNIAYRVTELVGFPSLVVRPQLMSYLSPAWERGAVEDAKRMVRAATLSFLALGVGLVGTLAVFVGDLFPLFVGDGPPTGELGPMVALIGGGVLANGCRRFLAVVVRLDRRTRAELAYQTFGLALNLGLNVVLVPSFGLAGAALATLLAYGAVLPLYARGRGIGFDGAFFAHVGSFVAIATLVAGAGLLLDDGRAWVVVGGAALSYLVYLGLVLWLERRFFGDLRRQVVAWQRPS